MAKIAVIYHSRNGHTKVLANHIALGISSLNTEALMIDCTKEVNWEVLNSCDALIFGCPTYMGSVSGEMKMFMDSCGEIFIHQKWRNKIAAGFTNSNALSGDKLNTLIQLSIFAFQHGMIWIGLDLPAGVTSSKHDGSKMNRIGSWIGLMSQSSSNEGPDLTPPNSDRKTAEYFGRRIGEFAKKLRAN